MKFNGSKMVLFFLLTLTIACKNNSSFSGEGKASSSNIVQNINNPDFVPDPEPAKPPTSDSQNDNGGGGTVPPNDNYPGDYAGTPACGGGDAKLYQPYSELVKTQHPKIYSSYGECMANMQTVFGNSYNCSKMVAATLFGCPQTADHQGVVFEATFALPVFLNGQMELPYQYFVWNVPDCLKAKDFLNQFTDTLVPTSGSFTSIRGKISASCHSSGTLVVQIYSAK